MPKILSYILNNKKSFKIIYIFFNKNKNFKKFYITRKLIFIKLFNKNFLQKFYLKYKFLQIISNKYKKRIENIKIKKISKLYIVQI